MVGRLLLILFPCLVAVVGLSWVAWQRFDIQEAQQQVEKLETVLGAEDSAPELLLVTRVIDGDTVELENGEKVRYIGIDTPETQHPSLGKQCYGPEATERNRQLVEGKRVKLEADKTDMDRYDRLLRYVWIEDVLINEVMVREGFAESEAYPPDIKHQLRLDVAEVTAQVNQVGLWSACPDLNL
jgi:micrococcal nuclease